MPPSTFLTGTFCNMMNRLSTVRIINAAIPAVLLTFVILQPICAAPLTPADAKSRHEQAVQLAREGQIDKGLEILSQLQRNGPQDATILNDLIVVLG